MVILQVNKTKQEDSKMISSPITYQGNYKGYPLYFSLDSDGYYVDILERNLQFLLYMLDRHPQVLLVRFDFTFPVGMLIPEDNSFFQRFIENYRRYLYRHGFDPVYLWVRERSKSTNQHYHCYFLLDGNVRNKKKSIQQVEELWCDTLGLIGDARTRYVHINRRMITSGDRVCLNESFMWLGYLAKVTTKGSAPRYIREFGCSQLPDGNFFL